MSKEKLYMVKNDEGEYWDFRSLVGGFWSLYDLYIPVTVSEENAQNTAKEHGGYVVTLIEQPEKVVLTKEQAKTVKSAHGSKWPALLIDNYANGSKHEEELLMNAYVNGYTVAKEKKYNVKVPHTKEAWYYQFSDTDLLTICPADKKLRGEFTAAEIEQYGLQDCERVEINTEDSNGN